MNFFQYMFNLLTRPFRKNMGYFLLWLKVMGKLLDDLKESVYKVRRAWLIQTATDKALELHGKARKLERYPGEPEEYYRQRVLTILQMYSSGTKPGMEKLLTDLGYPGSRIIALDQRKEALDSGGFMLDGTFKLDGSRNLGGDANINLEYWGRWHEYYIDLNIGQKRFLKSEYLVLLEMINTAKNAHEVLAFFRLHMIKELNLSVQVDCSITVLMTFRIQIGQYNLLDGTKNLDGTWDFGGSTYVVNEKIKIYEDNQLIEEV